MEKALIKIGFRQIINSDYKTEFEQDVFNDTYQEFCMQVQSFAESKKFTAWKDICLNPKANVNVQYKTGFSIGLYVKKLNNLIPGLTDSLSQSVPFESYRFEILESDTIKKDHHQVAITWFTDTLTFYGMIGEYMLLSSGDQSKNEEPVATFLLKMQPNLSVVSYQELTKEEKLLSELA